MLLKDKISEDLKAAMKAKDDVRKSVLRMVLAEIKKMNVEKNAKEVTDEVVLNIFKKQLKQRNDTIEIFKTNIKEGEDNSSVEEKIEAEKSEIVILEEYLPKMASAEEIEAEVKSIMSENGISDKKGMGIIMKGLKAKFSASLDGKMASQIVGKLLS